jgi:hypothetical protein
MYIRLIALLSIPVVKLISFSGGAFMFCTREAFQASGGFSEKMFWGEGEEGSFALALKRRGRFVGLWQWVHTSGRRFRKTSALELFLGGIHMVFSSFRVGIWGRNAWRFMASPDRTLWAVERYMERRARANRRGSGGDGMRVDQERRALITSHLDFQMV